MTRLQNLNISVKLTLITVAASTVALLCVLVAFVVQDLRLVKRIKAEQVESQLSILTGNLANALVQNDLHTVDYLLKNGTSVHGIIAASVYDRNGGLLSQYPVVAGKLTPLPNPEGFEFSSVNYSRPIIWRGSEVGRLEVEVSYADIELRSVYMGAYSALAFLFALAIAALVAWLVQKIVSQPLLQLHRLSRAVMETGNYSLRAEVRSSDELGQLGEAFNQMLNQIEQRDLMMERQVVQRTRELQKLAEEFRYRALHDTLTGLPNRALLNEEFNRAAAHARRAGKQFAVLLLDLDNFKHINDTYGHEVGDELLKTTANKIRSALRAEDIVCRLGGDEFIVLIESVQNIEHIQTVADGLLQAMQDEFSVANRRVTIGLSIGAAVFPMHGTDLNELKRNADVAMYCAKEAGKNRLAIYDPAMGTANLNKHRLHHELKLALQRRELELYFQPQVNLETNQVAGCEVLVRWHHHKRGLMLPGDFLSFAEESGLLKAIDLLVLREACQQCQTWRLEFGLSVPVSVNIANLHFLAVAEFAQEVSAILRETELPPSMLTIEFSGAALLQDSSAAGELVKALRELGVKVALDGFGASLFAVSHLHEIQLDCIKLDPCLYRGIVQDPDARRMAKGLVAFTRELGMNLVVEGVEQEEQLQVLRSLGCSVAQGFALASPMSHASFLRWVRHFHRANAFNKEFEVG
ncbi:EAL domain-containing protein [Saccharophagus sp. K07]|uniref:EAL domain-containing protein n=1 Tax=Saccharophagus sp. K07 TaxID=2283636 RepID=UPI001651DCD8|nr:EAL domain-containing protein [Saccharophagus sp. K07]MBC6905583.1 EAL domain-containing protein [Saccharophagus sp. K07]